jgi:hypothetical protein
MASFLFVDNHSIEDALPKRQCQNANAHGYIIPI